MENSENFKNQFKKFFEIKKMNPSRSRTPAGIEPAVVINGFKILKILKIGLFILIIHQLSKKV